MDYTVFGSENNRKEKKGVWWKFLKITSPNTAYQALRSTRFTRSGSTQIGQF